MSHPDRKQPEEIIIDIDSVRRLDAEESRLLLLLVDKFGDCLTYSKGSNGIEVSGAKGIVSRGKDLYEILGIKRPEEMRQLLVEGFQKLIDTLLKVRERFVAVQKVTQSHLDTPPPEGLETDPLKITMLSLLNTMHGKSQKLVVDKLKDIDGLVGLYRKKIALVDSLKASDLELAEKALKTDQEATEHNKKYLQGVLEKLLGHLTLVGIQVPMPPDSTPPEPTKS